MSRVLLILQQQGKNSINEKFHSRFFRSKSLKGSKKKIREDFLSLFTVRQNLLCCARVENGKSPVFPLSGKCNFRTPAEEKEHMWNLPTFGRKLQFYLIKRLRKKNSWSFISYVTYEKKKWQSSVFRLRCGWTPMSLSVKCFRYIMKNEMFMPFKQIWNLRLQGRTNRSNWLITLESKSREWEKEEVN